MRIESVAGDGSGIVDLNGVRHAVDLTLIEAPCPGDHVIVHAGFAIERLDPAEADARIEMFRSLAETNAGGGGPPPATTA